MAMGSVGSHGTVLQHKDLAIYNVTVRGAHRRHSNHARIWPLHAPLHTSLHTSQPTLLSAHLICFTGDAACNKQYTAEAPCDADNVTDGGCVWCDIVDRPAFCTSRDQNNPKLPHWQRLLIWQECLSHMAAPSSYGRYDQDERANLPQAAADAGPTTRTCPLRLRFSLAFLSSSLLSISHHVADAADHVPPLSYGRPPHHCTGMDPP